jgi:hypothetical protein
MLENDSDESFLFLNFGKNGLIHPLILAIIPLHPSLDEALILPQQIFYQIPKISYLGYDIYLYF